MNDTFMRSVDNHLTNTTVGRHTASHSGAALTVCLGRSLKLDDKQLCGQEEECAFDGSGIIRNLHSKCTKLIYI